MTCARGCVATAGLQRRGFGSKKMCARRTNSHTSQANTTKLRSGYSQNALTPRAKRQVGCEKLVASIQKLRPSHQTVTGAALNAHVSNWYLADFSDEVSAPRMRAPEDKFALSSIKNTKNTYRILPKRADSSCEMTNGGEKMVTPMQKLRPSHQTVTGAALNCHISNWYPADFGSKFWHQKCFSSPAAAGNKRRHFARGVLKIWLVTAKIVSVFCTPRLRLATLPRFFAAEYDKIEGSSCENTKNSRQAQTEKPKTNKCAPVAS